MACKDLFHSIKLENAKTGAGVDTSGFSSITFGIVSTGTAKVNLIEGDTAEKLTDVSIEDYLGEPLDTKGAGLTKIGYRGNKRFVGVKITGDATAMAILGHADLEPVE
ncbi:hypothetical protein FDF74_11410 [Clostridium niameyense]|uniref:Uncharacterized protein n=1 Tax=Clostridium niameyense TaxID=1622073 RepID=A0A6M0REC0_9CLOT|nr:hypothetical protein [Clostridium niameyense]NEZ47788.1 hypothetical protein [Clostridium niameyense]